MAEYICREETVKKIEEKLKVDDLMSLAEEVWTDNCLKIVLKAIMAVETANVQPVKRGRWKYYKNNGIFDTHKCTLCGEKYEIYMDIEPTTIYKYCPNCGAKMIKDGDTE